MFETDQAFTEITHNLLHIHVHVCLVCVEHEFNLALNWHAYRKHIMSCKLSGYPASLMDWPTWFWNYPSKTITLMLSRTCSSLGEQSSFPWGKSGSHPGFSHVPQVLCPIPVYCPGWTCSQGVYLVHISLCLETDLCMFIDCPNNQSHYQVLPYSRC